MSSRFATRQGGAIGLMTALTLALAVVFGLLAVDGGRLYMEQRKLQRIVDMAALEAAGQGGSCNGIGQQAAPLANTSAVRNGFTLGGGNTLVTTCGSVSTGANSLRSFNPNASLAQAIKVAGTVNVPTSIAAGIRNLVAGEPIPETLQLHAQAVATAAPVAMLRLRSTLLTMDTQKSALLNALIDPLGGRVTLDAVGWQGIANTQVNLLSFLDALAIKANVGAGHYDELLAKDLHVTDIVQVAANVANQSGALAEVVTNLGKVVVGANNSTVIHLGDMLDIQNGTPRAGLDTMVNVIDLVQASVMLAAKESAAVAQIPLNLLGLVTGTISLKVIEPEQFSAIGNPETDEIKVHTAQVKALISLDLPILKDITGLVNEVLSLASPLTTLIGNLLSLNLKGTLQSVGCALLVPCKVSDIQLMPNVQQIHIGIKVAKATSEVSDYSCTPAKTLTASTESSVADVAVGKFDTPSDFFNSGTAVIQPIPLIDFGTNVCTRLIVIPLGCDTRVPFAGGGIGIKVDTTVLGTPPGTAVDVLFSGATAPPNLNQLTVYKSTPGASNAVASLGTTLTGVQLLAYQPQGAHPLGQVVTSATGLLNGVKNILVPKITTLLDRLTNPLINSLLKVLGIDLLVTDVGANLTCNRAQLVL
ncbi:pilus assembly protein TadG-related protein [Pseudomonas sp. 5P_5.1_Bac1]|uniref:pilus assembly protein TadG-related protein n=1 Tax=Pseudomonas sp. 5P_5.1_Bac1 TaxID=2971616 RepID=UPI0021C568B8|nr:pilus assembly protein TadG-related protein [Pseudomonas sp. 5P_5.1_Bac1]MCU1723989.1 pilus assembly protein TadG-related protein [Pseudomonas sp. 5P_5.1_Bac1]